jgi:hypothetical protein
MTKLIKESLEDKYINVFDVYLQPHPRRDRKIFNFLKEYFDDVTFNGVGRDNVRLITVRTKDDLSYLKEILEPYFDVIVSIIASVE